MALLTLAALAASSASAEKAPPTAPQPHQGPLPLAVNMTGVPEIFPNGTTSGSIGAGQSRFFKVFANRSDAAPETLTVSLEATGSLFNAGSLTVYDPEQVILDEQFTRNAGDIRVSQFIVPETGYYLLVVAADATYVWSVTVNWSQGVDFPTDADNDHANATVLAGLEGVEAGDVANWDDLVDLYAIDLQTSPPYAEALLVNLTSPNTADIDLFIYHLDAGLAIIDGLSISPIGTEYAAALPAVAGRYYIRVMSYAGTSNYSMQWGLLNVSADHNSEPATAAPLGVGAAVNNLSRWDLRDLFVFSAPANTTVNVSLHTVGYNATSRTPNLQAVLWDANFSRVTWSFAFDPDERINARLPANGTYYLDIYAADIVYFLATNLSFGYTMDVSIDRPPALAAPGASVAAVEDTPVAVDLNAWVDRDSPAEVLAYSVVQVTGEAVASVGPDGRTLTASPAADWAGMAVVTVRATDRFESVLLDLPIAFSPVNDAPRLADGQGTLAFDEDAAATLLLASSVFDPEGNFWAAMGLTATSPLNATMAGAEVRVRGPPDFNGAGTVSLVVQDEFGLAAVLQIAVTIRAVNDAPRFSGTPPPFELLEDSSAIGATFNLSGLASDPDGEPVVYALMDGPRFDALVVGERLAVVPQADFVGDITATLVASDGSASSSVTVTLRVLPVDDAPRIVPPAGPLVGLEGSELSITAEASDIDTPLSELTFSFSFDGGPESAPSPSATFTRTPSFDEGGFHVLRVTVSDGNLTAAAEFAVFVSEVNRGPTALILSPRNATLPQGAVVSFSGRAADPDGDSVNVTWIVDGTAVSNSPTFSIDRMSPGRHSVELLVFDGERTATDTAQFEVQGGLPAFNGPFAALALALAAVGAALRGRSANAPKRLK